MKRGNQSSIAANLETLFSEGSTTGLSEGELLQRFLADRDEAAFGVLLERHGPMVLGVCRRRLSNPSDVDDAFQATFLVLVEQGKTLRDREVLGAWLYRVAHRIATHSRIEAGRRRVFEDQGAALRQRDRQSSTIGSIETMEWRRVFDDELSRLTPKYRTPLILCDLEGRTHEQAAAQLRCPVGTVKSRLSRARERLRSQLERRGLSATASLTLGAFPFEPVPASLFHTTARSATRLAEGTEAAVGTVAQLMDATLRSTRMTRLKIVATALTALGLVSAAAGLHARTPTGMQEPAPKTTKAEAQPQPKPQAAAQVSKDAAIVIRGRCVERGGKAPIPGAVVRLFSVPGHLEPIVEAAKAITDAQGRFALPQVAPPRPYDPIDSLTYLVFAESEGRPIGTGGFWNGTEGANGDIEIVMFREEATVSGIVRDTRGRAVAGATVAQWAIDGRPVPGILSAVSGPDGRFTIGRLSLHGDILWNNRFDVFHPDHPESAFEITDPSKPETVTLQDGCRVSGTVVDGPSGKPAAGAIVTAERLGVYQLIMTSTDAAGRFSLIVKEDRYNFHVRAKDRVCLSQIDQECLVGEPRQLPAFKLIEGGFIAGRVLDAATGEPITVGNGGEPVYLSLFGPSQPLGKVVSPSRMAFTDLEGRFKLRAAPGDNFPYFVNLSGDRMGWDTTKKGAVAVKEGETTFYDMLVTKEVPSTEKLKAAKNLIAKLPAASVDRTSRILEEFRKLSQTVDEPELWCMLMRELVNVGRDAVPPICDELDKTALDVPLRRLAFALRAIGDKRGVPALIRAIPRTLIPPSSDYGLLVTKEPAGNSDADVKALLKFMQDRDLREGPARGIYFDFGRPVREVVVALHKLTGKDFNDAELFGIFRNDVPRMQLLQRRIFTKHAQSWASWWDKEGRTMVDDPAYQVVHLKADDEAVPVVTKPFGRTSKVVEDLIGMTLSPASQQGGDTTPYFYDLDTGAQPKWPAHIPKDEAKFDLGQLTAWATEKGVDLMCITQTAPDGTPTFVLRQFGMKVREITPRQTRNLQTLLTVGMPPEGREVGELLIHADEANGKPEPSANGNFLYITREGNQGLIEITDQVTKTADLTGPSGSPPRGVGFNKGVRFNLRSIVP